MTKAMQLGWLRCIRDQIVEGARPDETNPIEATEGITTSLLIEARLWLAIKQAAPLYRLLHAVTSCFRWSLLSALSIFCFPLCPVAVLLVASVTGILLAVNSVETSGA